MKPLATKSINKEPTIVLARRCMRCHSPRARLQRQLLYLRHMCVFHHAGSLLKGTPGQLSVKLDIPEIVLRHLLEVCFSCGLCFWPCACWVVLGGFAVLVLQEEGWPP